jgi:thymidylate synthase (FAD)
MSTINGSQLSSTNFPVAVNSTPAATPDPGAQSVTTPAIHSQDIKVVMPEGATFYDVMGGANRLELSVLDHGFIALVDTMPRLVPSGHTADQAIVQAARVSYGQGTKHVNEDTGLIRYLLRHRHTTPFEMVEFKFHICMPIFIARQWIRHRTANVNEYSGRYSIIPDRFYTPTAESVRKQSASNRQGGEQTLGNDEGELKTAQEFVDFLSAVQTQYSKYIDLTNKGVSREMARIGLPVNMYTEWYWKIDLHNLLHFMGLRLDGHAQLEIREYAAAMYKLVHNIVPITMQAWRDYHFEALHLTRLEIEAIRSGSPAVLNTSNKREQAEWDTKRARLGL